MTTQTYVGSELGLFDKARNWKAYYAKLLRQHLQGEVLEVGAGIGSATLALCDGTQRRWVCLEPDSGMATTLMVKIATGQLYECCEVFTGMLADLRPDDLFDAIVYADVLEHIESDRNELLLAVEHLKTPGTLVIMAPAHQSLYTAFDAAVGHFRRYDKASLKAIIPRGLDCIEMKYLDSVGLCATSANRLMLRSPLPKSYQLAIWDKFMIPVSRLVDPLLNYRLGKSILGIWRKRLPAARSGSEIGEQT